MLTRNIRAFLEKRLPEEGPCLVYDLGVIASNFAHLSAIARTTGVGFLFPVKAFPFQPVLTLAARHCAGFDVSNAAEVSLCPVGPRGRTLSLCAPGLDSRRIRAALTARGMPGPEDWFLVSCETPEQVSAARDSLPAGSGILLRMHSPALLDRGHLDAFPPKRLACSRFGAAPEGDEIDAMVSLADDAFAGFHVHHGLSHYNTSENYLVFARSLAEACRRRGWTPRILNFGGGLWRMQFRELAELSVAIASLFEGRSKILFEPGRLISRGAGFGVGTVLAAKSLGPGRKVRVVDLSPACHLRWNEPRLLGRPKADTSSGACLEVVGPTCFEDDVFPRVPVPEGLPEAELLPVGSRVVFCNVNGYAAAWNTSFNGVEPAEVCFV